MRSFTSARSTLRKLPPLRRDDERFRAFDCCEGGVSKFRLRDRFTSRAFSIPFGIVNSDLRAFAQHLGDEIDRDR